MRPSSITSTHKSQLKTRKTSTIRELLLNMRKQRHEKFFIPQALFILKGYNESKNFSAFGELHLQEFLYWTAVEFHVCLFHTCKFFFSNMKILILHIFL